MAQLMIPPTNFFELSAELRNDIYDLCLRRPSTIYISSNGRNEFLQEGQSSVSGQLLRTCRRLYTEASSILYGSNSFILRKRNQPFLCRIGENVRHLRHIQMSFGNAEEFRACLLILRAATSLQTLRLDLIMLEVHVQGGKDKITHELQGLLGSLCSHGRRKADVMNILELGAFVSDQEAGRATSYIRSRYYRNTIDIWHKYAPEIWSDYEKHLYAQLRSALELALPEDGIALPYIEEAKE